jgi:hypothetical protein
LVADVFISYKSERRPAVAYLAQVLRNYGFDVWFDYSLVVGQDFARTIQQELRSAPAVLVMWCPLAVHAEWVLNEATDSKKRGSFTPVLLEPVDLPIEFIRADTIDLSQWDGGPRSHQLDRLIEQIAAKVGRDPEPRFRGLVEQERAWRSAGPRRLVDYPLDGKIAATQAWEHAQKETHATAAGTNTHRSEGPAGNEKQSPKSDAGTSGKDPNSYATLYCSFCDISQHETKILIAGPDKFICDSCVNICDKQITGLNEKKYFDSVSNKNSLPKFHCNFCNKSQNDVKCIIDGSNSAICNECIELCNQIIREQKS